VSCSEVSLDIAIKSLLLILVSMVWLSLSGNFVRAAEPFTELYSSTSDQQSVVDTTILEEIDKKIASLDLPPHSAETPVDTAVRIRKAIKKGDFADARQIVIDTLAATKLQPWNFSPFDIVMAWLPDLEDENFEKQLNDWVAGAEKDSVPLLLRAQFRFEAGWKKRGSGMARTVSAAKMKSFDNYMDGALDDANLAIDLNGSDPYVFCLRLLILQGYGHTNTLDAAFEDAIKVYPDYFSLYTAALGALQPKWGGSVRDMLRFANKYASNVSDSSPLKMLYLVLYDDLLDDAQVNCDDRTNSRDEKRYNQTLDCYDRYMKNVKTPELDGQVKLALKLFDHYPHEQFQRIAEPTINSMLKRYGGAKYANAILQQMAGVAKSDLQLPTLRAQTQKNVYMIDTLMATSWRTSLSINEAIMMLNQAALDIRDEDFTSEGDKLQRLADVYHRIAEYSQYKSSFPDVVVYERAALSLTSLTSGPAMVCFGLFQLRQYKEAAKNCTDILDKGGNATAHFWRGMSYSKSQELDAALADLTIVADSNLALRVNAAMEMSTIRYTQNSFQGAVDVLNKYPYLFDLTVAGSQRVAQNYNNRCFAYQNLGQLEKALDDCTESLKYGSIPDALKTRQELLQQLGKQ
jgi:tetratricopeptide (TPR) repeat protein